MNGISALAKGTPESSLMPLPREVTPRKQQEAGSELTLNVLVPRSQTPILQDGERFKSAVQELPSVWCPVPAAWGKPRPRTASHPGRQASPSLCRGQCRAHRPSPRLPGALRAWLWDTHSGSPRLSPCPRLLPGAGTRCLAICNPAAAAWPASQRDP